jgi:hypothetical protein
MLHPPEGSAGRTQELRGDGIDVQLQPGQSTELSLSLPALDGPGAWRLDVDLVDEGVKWFAAMGSEPLALQLLVREGARG